MGIARSFQIPKPFRSMTVLENMLVALACHENRLSTWLPAATSARVLRADEVLSRFNLLKHRDRLVSELPGGLRKLIDIAVAILIGVFFGVLLAWRG